MKPQDRLYTTETTLRRPLTIAYPAETGRLVLRTEQDWDLDVEAVSSSDDRTIWTFELEADQPYLYFKPCLVRDDGVHWALGSNNLVLMGEEGRRVCYPRFFDAGNGRFSRLVEFPSAILGREHRLR